MPPIMIYGQSSALDGVDDLAMSQANWGKIIQDKLKEFHQAEDVRWVV